MTKKYDSKESTRSFWARLATLLAPQDEAVLSRTREVQKAAQDDPQEQEPKRRPLATPSFDQQLSLIQTFD